MYCFDRTKRILTKEGFEYVFEQAKKITTSELVILYRLNNLNYPRLGLAIAKKAIAKSHDRNRIKRIIRESFRLTKLPAYDIVVLAKRDVAKAVNSQLFVNLGKVWDKLNTK